MSRLFRKAKRPGLSPGTLEHTGKRKQDSIKATMIDYTTEAVVEQEVKNIEDCIPFKDRNSVTWLNIDGLHDPSVMEKIGNAFGVHPLILEDILNVDQRPKIEDLNDYIFMTLRMLFYDDQQKEVQSDQLSLIIGKHFVISFQERESSMFDPVKARIRSGKGNIRKSGPDYLAYALLDVVVDNYFTILEKFGMDIEEVEEKIIEKLDQKIVRRIHVMKREMIFLRKSIWPMREVVRSLEMMESPLVNKKTRIYIRDIYDHIIQAIDTAESLREMVTDTLELYMSSMSNRMNQVMQVLTVIATIFIPLTFVTSLYGMNFDTDISPFNMPELEWQYGYPFVLSIMLFVVILMLFYFRRKGWV